MRHHSPRHGRSSERFLALAALIALIVALAAGMLVPLYTDEIGWRFQERAGADGVDTMLNDLCGPASLAHPPWFMMPVRWFSAAANQALADPFFVRLEGVGCALAAMLLIWLLAGRIEPDTARRAHLRGLVFALLGMGVMPLLLVLSRPEQPLLLCLALTMLAVFARVPAWLKVAVIVVLAAIALSYHLKGVAFAPVAFAALFVCAKGKGTRLPRIAGAAVLALLVATAARYWIARFQCPGDALLAGKLAGENFSALLLGGGRPGEVLGQIVTGGNPFNYVWMAVPDNDPVGFWLPPGLYPQALWLALAIAISLLLAAAIWLAIAAVVRFLKREGRAGLVEPRIALAATILACVVVWGASQTVASAYEAILMQPLLGIMLALCLSLPGSADGAPLRGMSTLVRVAGGCAALSMVAVLSLTMPRLIAAAKVAGYVADQPNSVSIGSYNAVRRDITRAMAMAGFPRERRLRRLLVDDVTYLALQRSHLPLHRLGVLEVWNGSITDPVQYLASRGSDGAVLGCRYLPAEMRGAAARSGEICALSGETLARLAGFRPPS